MISYYRNEYLFSEIYLQEITQQAEKDEILASLETIKEYRNWADTSDIQAWKSSFVHEVLYALRFGVKAESDHVTLLYPMGTLDQPISVCYILLPGEDLDNTTMGRNWAEKIIRNLREHDLQWGVLTNGEKWRIYHLDEPTPYETYLEIDLAAILADKATEAFKIFHKFLQAENFIVNDKEESRFDLFKKESQAKIDYIEEELANALKQKEEGGQGVLSSLCMGYVEYLREREDPDFDDEELRRKIYHGAMLYMFRMLFLFYADARDLLSDQNEVQLEAVRQKCWEYHHKGIAKNANYSLWEPLESIFVDIDQTYNGGLFNPFESDFTQFIEETRVTDAYLAPAVYHMAHYHEKSGDERRISYRDMSVRHLGTLYEGLLEHKLFIAKEDTEVKISSNRVEFITSSQGGKILEGQYINEGDIYFGSDPSERKATGSYYTPEYIVECMVSETVGKKLNIFSENFTTKNKSLFDSYSLAVSRRERTGISRLIEESLIRFIADEVLNLSVLDPAMGSGHFLVNATNSITNFTIDFLNELNIQSEVNTNPAYWRRIIVEHCIFGVDVNPLAVELAKLSLWILAMAKKHPLSFLNHHLKCGNSLISTPLSFVGKFPGFEKTREKKQTSFFEESTKFKDDIQKAITNLTQIKKTDTSSLEDIIQKRDWLEEANNLLQTYKLICDFHTDIMLGEKVSEWEYYTALRTVQPPKHSSVKSDCYFHWELEFPDPLLLQSGFDVIITNPPYLGEKGNKQIFRLIANSPWGQSYYRRKMDLFYFFFHLALDLTKEDSNIGFITTNYYITADGAENLRKDLKNRSTILSLYDFGELRLFPSAGGQHNMITVLRNGVSDHVVSNFRTKRRGDADKLTLQSMFGKMDKETNYWETPQKDLFDGTSCYIRLSGNKAFSSSDQGTSFDYKRIDDCTMPLSNFSEHIFRGVETGCNKVTNSLIRSALSKGLISQKDAIVFNVGTGIYVLTEKEIENIDFTSLEWEECIKPFYKNSEIERYLSLKRNDKYLLYVDSQTDINRFPNVKYHLKKFKPLLAAREQAVTDEHNWFWIRGSKRNSYEYRKDFIVVPYRSKTSRFSICYRDIYGATDVFYVSLKRHLSTKALLGYLNSSLVFFHLFRRGKRKGEIIEYVKRPITQIPIHPSIFQQPHVEILEKLVDKIITQKRTYGQSDTTLIENKIDEYINNLFDFSLDEISIIESINKS